MKTIILLLLMLCFCVFGAKSSFIINDIENKLGANVSGLYKADDECEKSIPRDQECVMVFDFVPVKKGEDK